MTDGNAAVNKVCKALQRAVDQFGSEHALAIACGVTQSAISKAKHTTRVSPELALAIHRATRGEVPGSVLRPDLWRKASHVPTPRKRKRTSNSHGVSPAPAAAEAESEPPIATE